MFLKRSIDDREVYCRNHVPIAKPHDPTLPSPVDHFSTNGIHNNGIEHRQRQLDAGLQDLKIAVKIFNIYIR